MSFCFGRMGLTPFFLSPYYYRLNPYIYLVFSKHEGTPINRMKLGLGKYDQTRYLKKTKARTIHQCDMCNAKIELGEHYYAETQKDRFLHSLHAECFCSKCYEKYGDELLSIEKKKRHEMIKSRSLRDFF